MDSRCEIVAELGPGPVTFSKQYLRLEEGSENVAAGWYHLWPGRRRARGSFLFSWQGYVVACCRLNVSNESPPKLHACRIFASKSVNGSSSRSASGTAGAGFVAGCVPGICRPCRNSLKLPVAGVEPSADVLLTFQYALSPGTPASGACGSHLPFKALDSYLEPFDLRFVRSQKRQRTEACTVSLVLTSRVVVGFWLMGSTRQYWVGVRGSPRSSLSTRSVGLSTSLPVGERGQWLGFEVDVAEGYIPESGSASP